MTNAKVFISHASVNFRVADDLRARLEELGITCWIAPRDIPAGSSYGEQITGAIQGSNALVLVLTEEANASRAVANELEMAFRHQRVIIPVRLKPVEPSSSLAFFVNNTQWVDACHTPLKQRVHEIARIVRAVASRLPPPPPAPEQRTFLASLERRVEGLIRYKLLTLVVALAVLAGLGGMAALMSGKTLSIIQAEQNLINADPNTFGLVNLAADPDQHPAASQKALRATVYLNLKDATLAKVSWRAYWSGPGGVTDQLDVAALALMRTAGAHMLTVSVPFQATAVVFCMSALHPVLDRPHTARWDFAVDTAQRPVAVARAGAPQLRQASERDCTP